MGGGVNIVNFAENEDRASSRFLSPIPGVRCPICDGEVLPSLGEAGPASTAPSAAETAGLE
jgi:hypothetical protein